MSTLADATEHSSETSSIEPTAEIPQTRLDSYVPLAKRILIGNPRYGLEKVKAMDNFAIKRAFPSAFGPVLEGLCFEAQDIYKKHAIFEDTGVLDFIRRQLEPGSHHDKAELLELAKTNSIYFNEPQYKLLFGDGPVAGIAHRLLEMGEDIYIPKARGKFYENDPLKELKEAVDKRFKQECRGLPKTSCADEAAKIWQQEGPEYTPFGNTPEPAPLGTNGILALRALRRMLNPTDHMALGAYLPIMWVALAAQCSPDDVVPEEHKPLTNLCAAFRYQINHPEEYQKAHPKNPIDIPALKKRLLCLEEMIKELAKTEVSEPLRQYAEDIYLRRQRELEEENAKPHAFGTPFTGYTPRSVLRSDYASAHNVSSKNGKGVSWP